MSTEAIRLKPREREIVAEIVGRLVPGFDVYVFGSRATGKATRSSDLDLAFEGDEPLEHSNEVALKTAFEESNLDFFVDVVDVMTAGPTLREAIRRDGRLLVSRKVSPST